MGPVAPKRIDTSPEDMLGIVAGIQKGETRMAALVARIFWLSNMVSRPAIPEPMMTPIRSAFEASIDRPECSIASVAAAIA